MRARLQLLAFPLALVLCAAAVTTQRAQHAAAPQAVAALDADGAELPAVQRASFPFGAIIDMLSNPVVINFIALVGVAIYNRVAKANESADRWARITSKAVAILDDIRQTGLDWQKLVPLVLKHLVDEVGADPSIRSLSSAEVEKLKPFVVALAKRRTGVVEVPMSK